MHFVSLQAGGVTVPLLQSCKLKTIAVLRAEAHPEYQFPSAEMPAGMRK